MIGRFTFLSVSPKFCWSKKDLGHVLNWCCQCPLPSARIVLDYTGVLRLWSKKSKLIKNNNTCHGVDSRFLERWHYKWSLKIIDIVKSPIVRMVLICGQMEAGSCWALHGADPALWITNPLNNSKNPRHWLQNMFLLNNRANQSISEHTLSKENCLASKRKDNIFLGECAKLGFQTEQIHTGWLESKWSRQLCILLYGSLKTNHVNH